MRNRFETAPTGRVGTLVTLLMLMLCGRSPAQDAVKDGAEPKEQATAVTVADARDLLMQGSYEAATEAYQKLSNDPAHAVEAGLGLARCRVQVGQHDEAIAGLTAMKAEASTEWHCLLAELYTRVGKYDDAAAHLQAAIKTDQRHAGARLQLGRLQELLGRRDDAIETYRWFDRQLVERPDLPKDAAWISDAAQGFLRYSVLTGTDVPRRTQHVLSEMLQPAYTRLDRTYWPARIAAGDLLRERFNNDEEDGSVSDYQAALRINPNLCEAQVGLGEVALDGWQFEEVERRAELALKVNPNFAPAIHLLAKKLILERRYEQAQEPCERALKVNPNDLVALSLSAAASACRYDRAGVAQMQALAAAINPRCAMFHRTLGDALSGIRQYAASEEEYRKAIELDGTDVNARTELGMMYMQWGLEEKARDALDAAWALDPYNQRTKFTLDLLDRLHKFARYETPHFVVKYDAERDAGLGEYVATYLEPIYDAVTTDFETPLTDKTIIEIFPTHRAFGVRITGKPWIHTVGASTGRIIALASPRESTDLMGRYNLARVLKHEFTHTVTLAATDNRIPHWFTEGLAVFEEDAPRPFGWCELLADAVRRDRLFTLESIDWGFIRPRRPADRQMAYAQSEWMVEYIVERFGYDMIQTMVKAFRGGRTQSQVFTEQLGVESETFNRDFHDWAYAQVPRWNCRFDLTSPEDLKELRALAAKDDAGAGVFGRLARAELDEADYEWSMAAARRALSLDENERHGLEVLASVLTLLSQKEMSEAGKRGYEDEALPLLERLSRVNPDSRAAAKHWAAITLRRKEWDRAAEALQRLQQLCPIDPASWGGLAGVYLERGEDDRALPQLLELARIEQNDADVARKAATILRRRGDLREAQYWFRQALSIDPSSVELHQAMGDVSMQSGDSEAALREYKTLTDLQPTNVKHFESAALAAHKLGNAEQAQAFARQALKLDPQSPVRTLVPE
ncbi:MAG: tetratricopeptide repeat protein [Planctomycetota bacterium]